MKSSLCEEKRNIVSLTKISNAVAYEWLENKSFFTKEALYK